MNLGRIVEIGSHADIYTDPRHPYTRALLSAAPAADPALTHRQTVLKRDVPSLINPPPGCRFHPRCAAVKKWR